MADYFFAMDNADFQIADESSYGVAITKRPAADLTAGSANDELGTFKSGISAYTASATFTGALSGGYIILIGKLNAGEDRMIPVKWAGSPPSPGKAAATFEVFKENETYDDGKCSQAGKNYTKYKITV